MKTSPKTVRLGDESNPSRTFQIGDRVRPKDRIDYTSTPIPRKSVGIVSDVIVSPVSGDTGYVVTFAKQNEWPILKANEMVRLPKPQTKVPVSTMLPKMPDDVK